MCNSPDTKITLDLPLQSDVCIWCKKEGWKEPYKLIAINRKTCIINMPQGLAKFQSTVIKPYFTEQPN